MQKKTSRLNPSGRFAPSPSGLLHFGSLVTAMASYLDVKSEGGFWWLRIEDIDNQRSQKDITAMIKAQLKDHGMKWDKWPELPKENEGIIFQSQRGKIYSQFLHSIISSGRAFSCKCTRKIILKNSKKDDCLKSGEIRYPGTCKKNKYEQITQGRAIRLISSNIDDFVLKRINNNTFSYALAVVIDDYLQNITNIIRGDDLKFTVERNIQLQSFFGFPLPKILHVPVVKDFNGNKLSKQKNEGVLKGGKHIKNQITKSWNYLQENMPIKWLEKVADTFDKSF